MGFSVTVQQYWPTIANLMHAGDLLCCDIPLAVGNFNAGDMLGWKQIVFYFLMHAPTAAVGSPLEAVIRGEAPSHTFPTFSYS